MRKRGRHGTPNETDSQILFLLALNDGKNNGLTTTEIARKIEEETGKDRDGVRKHISKLMGEGLIGNDNSSGRSLKRVNTTSLWSLAYLYNSILGKSRQNLQYISVLKPFFKERAKQMKDELVFELRFWNPWDCVYGLPQALASKWNGTRGHYVMLDDGSAARIDSHMGSYDNLSVMFQGKVVKRQVAEKEIFTKLEDIWLEYNPKLYPGEGADLLIETAKNQGVLQAFVNEIFSSDFMMTLFFEVIEGIRLQIDSLDYEKECKIYDFYVSSSTCHNITEFWDLHERDKCHNIFPPLYFPVKLLKGRFWENYRKVRAIWDMIWLTLNEKKLIPIWDDICPEFTPNGNSWMIRVNADVTARTLYGSLQDKMERSGNTIQTGYLFDIGKITNPVMTLEEGDLSSKWIYEREK